MVMLLLPQIILPQLLELLSLQEHATVLDLWIGLKIEPLSRVVLACTAQHFSSTYHCGQALNVFKWFHSILLSNKVLPKPSAKAFKFPLPKFLIPTVLSHGVSLLSCVFTSIEHNHYCIKNINGLGSRNLFFFS